MKCILVVKKKEPKDPNEIVDALVCCSNARCEEDNCPYYEYTDGCASRLKRDAANLIVHLLAANKDQSEKLKRICKWIEETERKNNGNS